MSQQILSPLPLLLIFLCYATALDQSPAQAPVAQSPAQAPVTQPLVPSPPARSLAPSPPGPPNITAILEKAGHFNTLIRLLKSTQLDAQIYKQLNDSSQSLTVFAPTDNAFGSLTTGALNSFSDQQKFQLIKFHLMSSFYSIPAFQTVSNPVSTEAGSTGQYPLNITVSGNQMNISTGIVNATVSSNVYSDNQLAVYEVDKVLLPLSFFVTSSPSPSPSPSLLPAPAVPVPEKKAPSHSGPSTAAANTTTTTTTPTTPSTDASASVQPSGATGVIQGGLGAMSFAGFLVPALMSLCV